MFPPVSSGWQRIQAGPSHRTCHSCARMDKYWKAAALRHVSQKRQGVQMWEAVGIPDVEARVYEALIMHGRSTVDGLSGRTNLATCKRPRARGTLRGRGRATRTPGRPARYSAVQPPLARSVLIAQREHELGQLQ